MKFRSIILAIAASIMLTCTSTQAEEELLATTFDLKFPGGTVEEYVEAIRDTVNDVNIVVMPEATELYLEPFDLHQVDLYAAINLLQGLSEKTTSKTVTIITELTEAWSTTAKDIIVVQAKVHEHSVSIPKTHLVISVSDLFQEDGFTHEDMATAIETAMSISSDIYDEPDVRFHEETGLIIARGHPDQMATIEQVIDQLREGIIRRQQQQALANNAENQNAIRNLEMAIHKRDLMIKELELELSRLNREIDEFKKK